MSQKPISVILDTDVGDDIDDIWALVMLLRSPELDVKLVTTTSTQPETRARHAAKVLELAGRTDIPLAVGARIPGEKFDPTALLLHSWIQDYPLQSYPGKLHNDGPSAVIDTIRRSSELVTVISIGPLSNLGETLRRDPSIVRNSRFVGMLGSIYKGYGTSLEPSAETNARLFPDCSREVFRSAWDRTITPLDTCGSVVLDGVDYANIRCSDDPLIRELMKANDIFSRRVTWMNYDSAQCSSILYDTVAVYLAYSEELLEIETLPLHIDSNGYTRIDARRGASTRCALNWKNLEAFKAHLVSRILNRLPVCQ